MISKHLGVCAVLCLGLATLPSIVLAAPASDAASAKAFLERVYAQRQTAKDTALYDPSMLALLKEDKRLAHGELGAVDFDPICQCQDDDGMTAQVGSVQVTPPGAATAAVTLRFAAPGEPRLVKHVEFNLVSVMGAWRVHDIRSKQMPSLRAFILKSNAMVRR